MDIKRTPVSSSSIASIGHDPASNTMAVEFNNGGVYHYPGVTPADHQALLASKSIGQHFGTHFRKRPSRRQ